jgi:hypothetical protein
MNYHMLMPTFSSMNWVRLWKSWSLEKSQAYNRMGYLSTTNFKWQFYNNCHYWFNVTTLYPVNAKVPGLHKLQHTNHLQNPNIFSRQEFAFPNFASATSSANPWIFITEDETWTPFFVLASAGSTLWTLNYVLKYLKLRSSDTYNKLFLRNEEESINSIREK